MSEPMTPAQTEAEGGTVTVGYAGQSYTFPASLDDADGDVIDAIDDMKISHALQALMGDKEWKRFKATKPKLRDYGALFDTFAEKIGLGSTGESVASSTS